MASTPYSVGTITVANGSTSVAGADTFWVGKVRQNDMLFIPAQGLQARVTADPTDNEVLAITAWAGTGLTDAAYEIIPASDATTSAARLRDLLAQMSVVEANGRGLFYRFSDAVTDSDPGAGYVRLNNATIGSATAAYIDNLDANDAAVAGDLDTWDDSSSIIKGKLWLRSIVSPSSFHAFSVTGPIVDGTGYRKLTLTYVGGSGGFSDSEELMVFFVPKGDAGDGFAYDATVAAPAGLAAYESEDAGFLVFVTDLGTDFGALSGISGVVRLIAGPDWEVVARYTGLIGPAPNISIGTVTTLAAGESADALVTGANPNYVLNLEIPEGERGINWRGDYSGATAYDLDDGALYLGSSWRALQATTGNAPPTLPTTSNAYWQLLARQGIDGAGTVNSVVAGAGISVNNTDPTAPVISGLAVVKIQKFNASGTYTPDPNLIFAIAEVQGAGGGGGGVQGSSTGVRVGAGGASGGYSRKTLLPADIGVSKAITVGASGAVAAGFAGGAGGASSVGSLCVAPGGNGGANTTGDGGSIPTVGPTAGSGDVAVGGNGGDCGLSSIITSVLLRSGKGGASVFGDGGAGNYSGNGKAGLSPGSGGSGAAAIASATNVAGGAGASGVVIITEYCRA